jgi:DNA repair protein RadD
MKLFTDQEKVLNDLNKWFTKNPTGNPIVRATGGSGKSVMIAWYCRDALHNYP